MLRDKGSARQEPLNNSGPAKASDKRTVQNFRRKVLRELKKIKMAWAELNYTTAPGVLILLPSSPAIPPSSDSQRLVE